MVGRDGIEPPTPGFSVLGARSGKRRNRRGIKRFPSGPPRTKAYLLVGFHWVCVASLDVGGQSPGRRLILAGRWCVAGRIQVRDFIDRKSTRLNSSHLVISYAVFCLKKKKKHAI